MCSETITAIATNQGQSGIGVVRISGKDAKRIGEKITKKKLKIRSAQFSYVFNKKQEPLDQAIVIYYEKPKSFTGEDIVELQVHGNKILLNKILKVTIEYGARIANPGEFTERAYINGKIDLVQAEAINELIRASSEKATEAAMSSLRGKFSSNINKIVKQIIDIRSNLEMALDFPEEHTENLPDKELEKKIEMVKGQIHKTLQDCRQGKVLREGIKIVMVGETNVGKSSLLNMLTESSTAIVTDVPGTTRDLIKEQIQIDGMPFQIIDTAGIRKSDNKIENEGIKRTISSIKKADEILLIVDVSSTINRKMKNLQRCLLKYAKKKGSVTVVYNKVDLIEGKLKIVRESAIRSGKHMYISVKHKIGTQELYRHLSERVSKYNSNETFSIGRQRHIDSLLKSLSWVNRAMLSLEAKEKEELIAEDLKCVQEELSKITGKYRSDELLGEIFSKFCVGK